MFSMHFVRKDHLLLSSHDTPRGEPHQALATHSRIIEETSELVLRACGLGSTQSSDQLNQIQQCESTPRRRGRRKPGERDTAVEQLDVRVHRFGWCFSS